MTDMPPTAYGPPPQTAGKAIAALVFAVLAWLTCPVIFAIVALILASQADAEIRASAGALTGEPLVTAARVVAWINIALAGLLVVGAVVAVVLLAPATTDTPSNVGSSLERIAVTAPAAGP